MSNEELVQLQSSTENTEVQSEETTKVELDQLVETLPEAPSAQDMMAAFFERHKAQVVFGLSKVSLRGLKRVMMNVALGEFAPRGYDPKNEDERRLAFHFNECITKRGVMRLEEEFKRVEAAYAKEQEDLKKIDEMTQAELSEDAKKLLAESGDSVIIKGE